MIDIGWREWVKLPDLGRYLIKAKIDTGARSSALHASDIRIVRAGGRESVRFTYHPMQRSSKPTVEAEATLVDQRWVTSSNGHRSLRPVVSAELRIGEARWPIELTLTNRDSMGFRLLLGREALRGRCIIDPSRSFLTGHKLPGKKAKKTRIHRTKP